MLRFEGKPMRTHTKFQGVLLVGKWEHELNLNVKMEEIYVESLCKGFENVQIPLISCTPEPLFDVKQCLFQCFIGQKIHSIFIVSILFSSVLTNAACRYCFGHKSHCSSGEMPHGYQMHASINAFPRLRQAHVSLYFIWQYIWAYIVQCASTILWFILTRTQIFDYIFLRNGSNTADKLPDGKMTEFPNRKLCARSCFFDV